MKKLSFSLLIILLSASNAVLADVKSDFALRMAKIMQYVEENQAIVWPGFHPTVTPSVIQFIDSDDQDNEKDSAYALNFTPGKLPWQQIGIGPNSQPIYFLADSNELFPDSPSAGKLSFVDGENSFIDLENAKTIIATENLSNSFMTNRAAYYLKNESAIKTKYAGYNNINYDNFNNPNFLKLVYLEDSALTEAQSDDAGQAEIALRDAVAIHQYRNQLADKSALIFENGNEIIKGIPTFISWTSQNLKEDDYRKMSQRTGCMPLSSFYPPTALGDCALSGLPAFASSVYGHALEKKLPNTHWKSAVEQKFISISQLAIDYYHLSDVEAFSIAEAAKKKPEYHFDRIERIIDQTMLPYLEALHVAQNKYASINGIELHTTYELGSMFLMLNMFGNFYADAYSLNNHDTLIEDLNIKNEKTKNDDPQMAFDHLPYMLVHVDYKNYDIDPATSYSEIKLENNAQLIIDGKTIAASDFVRDKRKQTYQSLTISDAHVLLPLTAPGTLDATDGKLNLDMESGNKITRPLKSLFFHYKK